MSKHHAERRLPECEVAVGCIDRGGLNVTGSRDKEREEYLVTMRVLDDRSILMHPRPTCE